jgi:hypothetical protein
VRSWFSMVAASVGAACVARFVPLPAAGLMSLAGQLGLFVLVLFVALVFLKPLHQEDGVRLQQAFGRASRLVRLFVRTGSKGTV